MRVGTRPTGRLTPGTKPFARRPTVVGHLVGIALAIAGAGMLIAAAVEQLDGGEQVMTLVVSGLAIGAPGLLLWDRTAAPERIPAASIFAAVLTTWIALSFAGTLPYLLSGALSNFDDALFESVAGFTTTGSTLLRPLEDVAKGVLFWRATTQWMGGIGVVVLAVSVLPFLGVGGMELLATQAPGPSSERLAPRVRETAKRLLLIYVGFTAVVALLYGIFGMSVFDAVVHSFTTVSTGGFTTHDASFGAFSPAHQWIAVVAMTLAGGSYTLWWRAITGRPASVVRSTEFRAYLAVVVGICAAAVAWNSSRQGWSARLLRETLFSTTAITSTTGYTLLDYDEWATAVKLLLIFAMGLGGMAGSAAGGFKTFRLLTVLAYGRRQLFRQLHPKAVDVVRLGGNVVPDRLVARVVGFFGLFMAIGGLGTFLVAALSGTDLVTAISATVQAIGNVGPGMGEVGATTNFLPLERPARAVLMVVMLTGRLEVFPVLLGVVPLLRFVGDRLPRRVTQTFLRFFRG